MASQSVPYLHVLKEKAASQKRTGVVVFAEDVSPNVARHLRDKDINFVDANGNVFLNYPGKLYIYVEGQKPARPRGVEKGRILQPSGLQVLFLLLVDPKTVNLPYRDLAEKSGVALNKEKVTWALTGGSGANELVHHYRGEKLSLFVEEFPLRMTGGLHWLPMPQGPITLLRAFSSEIYFKAKHGRRISVVHPMLIYAELMYEGGDREKETAQLIYQRYLENQFEKD